MVDRHELYETVMKKTYKSVVSNNCDELLDYIYNKYNIPRGKIMDIIAERVEETEATSDDFILFSLLDGIINTQKIDKKLEDYFTTLEIRKYTVKKWKENKLKFPLVIDCIAIEDDIWVGAADVDWFMKLRNASKIKYNPDIQRTMTKRIGKDGNVKYEITKNKKAIQGIVKLYQSGNYIPNTIILNISDDSECEFAYDEEEKQLVIYSMNHLDILDGYHRYYGMCQTRDLDANFNDKFVLQITNFSTSKGQQYIHQQDLKTKMRAVDSASMNTADPANRICDNINRDNTAWQSEVRRNGGNVNLPLLSSVIWRYYLSNTTRKITQKDIKEITKEVEDGIDIIVETYPEYSEREISYREMCILMHYCKMLNGEKGDDYNESLLKTLPNVMEESKKEKYNYHWVIKGEYPLKPKTIRLISELLEKEKKKEKGK